MINVFRFLTASEFNPLGGVLIPLSRTFSSWFILYYPGTGGWIELVLDDHLNLRIGHVGDGQGNKHFNEWAVFCPLFIGKHTFQRHILVGGRLYDQVLKVNPTPLIEMVFAEGRGCISYTFSAASLAQTLHDQRIPEGLTSPTARALGPLPESLLKAERLKELSPRQPLLLKQKWDFGWGMQHEFTSPTKFSGQGDVHQVTYPVGLYQYHRLPQWDNNDLENPNPDVERIMYLLRDQGGDGWTTGTPGPNDVRPLDEFMRKVLGVVSFDHRLKVGPE